MGVVVIRGEVALCGEGSALCGRLQFVGEVLVRGGGSGLWGGSSLWGKYRFMGKVAVCGGGSSLFRTNCYLHHKSLPPP